MESYEKVLKRKGYEVVRCYTVDEAIAFARSNPPSVDAIILDLMMPAGEAFRNEDTEGGLKTGVLLYRELRKDLPNAPVLVLTNYPQPEILSALPSGDKRVSVKTKYSCPPLELPEVLEALWSNVAKEMENPE